MARITFDVRDRFDRPPALVWDALVDWEGHADWVPATTMDVEPGDPTEPGRRFTARTGVGPLALVDRMRVVTCDWDPERSVGVCEVEKLGPILRGRAGFTVSRDGEGATVEWVEDVTVNHVPQFVAPLAGKLGAVGFRRGLKRLAKQLEA